ncbi:MAG: hypothetical protein WD770_04525 [Actinomycetota bacterium]
MKMTRKALAAMAASLTIALLLWQGMALAVGGVGGLGVGTGSGSGNEAYSPEVADPPDDPTEDGDSEGHETDNPEKPDHAGGGIAEVQLAGGEVVSIGQNDAGIEDDGQAHSDVVVLSLLGSEIIGAHSNCPAVGCEGGEPTGSVAPGILCEESGGGVCVGILFAEANSSVENEESSSSADQVLAFACVGGTQTAPAENCDGVVGAGVSEQHSTITQDNTTGATDASSSTDVADVCVGPTGEDPITGVCSGLGVSALHSESSSSAPSETGPGTTERSSYLLAVELGGAPAVEISDPMDLSLPPGCPAGASLLCVFLNQGESFVYPGGAGSAQDALHISLIAGAVDGEDVVFGHVATAETLVENTGPACPPGSTADHCVAPPCPDTGGAPMPDGTCPQVPVPGLANTGLDMLIPLALALTLMVVGAHLVALDRRRGALTV